MPMEAETGVMCLQAQKHQGLLVTPKGRKRQGRLLREPLERAQPRQHLVLASGLQNCGRTHFCCLKPHGL